METLLIAESLAMRKLLSKAKRIAAFPSTVLIVGETGVGKEMMADYIHQHSPRVDMPFIKVNCGAIPESLLESEFFGYERGAFTGAKKEGNPGIFELADKGTILLDEIGELPALLQVKLLRVLQNREIRRIGGSWYKIVDVRVIACTNQNILQMVASGRFRQDLYYRLNVVSLRIPPLRERREDLEPLLTYYLEEFCREFNIARNLSEAARAKLLAHDYPGNIRELRNLVEALAVSVEDETIALADLPEPIRENTKQPLAYKYYMEQCEKIFLQDKLGMHQSIRKTAELLGISHASLLRKMKKYDLQLAKHNIQPM
jgi:two-component system response regulator AtoC